MRGVTLWTSLRVIGLLVLVPPAAGAQTLSPSVLADSQKTIVRLDLQDGQRAEISRGCLVLITAKGERTTAPAGMYVSRAGERIAVMGVKGEIKSIDRPSIATAQPTLAPNPTIKAGATPITPKPSTAAPGGVVNATPAGPYDPAPGPKEPPSVRVTRVDAKDFDLAVKSVSLDTSQNPWGDVVVTVQNAGRQTWAFSGTVSISVHQYVPPGTPTRTDEPFHNGVRIAPTIPSGQSTIVAVPISIVGEHYQGYVGGQKARVGRVPYNVDIWNQVDVILRFRDDQAPRDSRSYRFRVDRISHQVVEWIALINEPR